MKVLTAAQMREVDRRTIEMGIPGMVLMENAGHRVVELLAENSRRWPNIASWFFAAKGTMAATAWLSPASSSRVSPRAPCTSCCWPRPKT